MSSIVQKFKSFVVLTSLLLLAGGSEVWGQTTDYSGTYYIKNVSDNKQSPGDYYLCPTEGWAFYVADNSVTGTDNEKPFLTTYHCKNGIYDKTKAVWTIEKAPAPNSDYYYIRQIKTGRYMVSNGTMSSKNANRMRVHLETIEQEDLDDKELFSIAPYSTYLVIMPKASSGWNGGYKWYTVNKGNKDDLAGTNVQQDGPADFPNTGGIVGVYSIDDANAKWGLENAGPIITNNFDGTVTITAEGGATIYYTTNGDEPTTSSSTYSTPITLTEDMTVIKAISKTEGDVLSTTVTTYDIPVCARPAISVSGGNVTITCNIAGATIYYTTDDTPATSSSTVYTGPFAKGDISIIRAVATKAGYVISSEAILQPSTEVFSSAEITDMNGNYILAEGFSASSMIGSSSNPFKGTIDGNYNAFSLNHALIDVADGATIKNIIVSGATISGSDNAGAIVNTAKGDTKIYNCGVQSGSISGNVNVGGLVGLISSGSSVRVVNCYNYANISGGSYAAGIVGKNEGTVGNVRIALCMMYGTVSGATNISPVYAGNHVSNAQNFTEYNYYLYSIEKDAEGQKIIRIPYTAYNDQLAIDNEEYLTRFPFYRHILNNHRELAGYFLFGDYDGDHIEEIGHWVKKKGVDAPKYPVIEKWEKNRKSTPTKTKNDLPVTQLDYAGKLLTDMGDTTDKGYLNVSIRIDGNEYSEKLPITDMDTLRYDYNYGKVILPFANEYETNTNYSRICTGWKITEVTGGTAGSVTNYNFADRNCTAKDIYNEATNSFIFAQGGYYIVPTGVTAISIEANFAAAYYLSDATYEIGYDSSYSGRTGLGGDVPTTFHGQTVYNSLATAISNLATTTTNPHKQAIVLVGNYHYDLANNALGTGKGFTLMSIDEDNNQEPDYGFYSIAPDRPQTPALRFDFVPIISLGMAAKVNGSYYYPGVPIWKPRGWYEQTETTVSIMNQFELDSGNFTNNNDPCIINGGYFVQMIRSNNTNCSKVGYFKIGGNAYIKEFFPGSHSNKSEKWAKLVPINVTGGQVDECYMTGYKLGAKAIGSDIRFWCSGGKIGKFLGAYMDKPQQATDNVGTVNMTANVDHALIGRFFGGGTSPSAAITGNINVTINNSKVDFYCGGPEFGDMAEGKNVETTAKNTTFGEYYGAGFGGTSITYSPVDGTPTIGADIPFPSNSYTYGSSRLTNPESLGLATCYKFEFLMHSARKTNLVARFITGYANFNLATTGDVTNNLTGCIIEKDFYGAGCQGMVDGTVNSTLTDCIVKGSAFGGGYKAVSNEVKVYPTAAPTFARYNGETGVFSEFGKTTPEVFTWQQGTGTDPSADDSNKILYCPSSVTMANLGNVTGAITLTINGTENKGSIIGTEGTEGAGNVFGGGNESRSLDNTTVVMGGNTRVLSSVYGGGNLADVNGNTTVNVTGGTIGTTGKGGATWGNVYGGGKGLEDDVDAGLVKGNTNVTISGSPAILHNVYGGGAFGSVGTFTYDSTTGFPNGLTNETGTANVTIKGGTFGSDGKDNGMVFGSSRGSEGDPEAADSYVNKLAWVGNTNVIIGDTNEETSPAIMGSVYGGGENGHNYQDAHVTIHKGTIGITDPEVDGGARYPTRGNVYGAGCGTDTFERGEGDNKKTYYDFHAGIVQGNTMVTIDGGHVVHNVYGGGAMGTVGTYTLADEAYHTAHPDVPVGKPYECTAGGLCTISITGGKIGMTNATMTGHGNDGPDDFGHVFGAGRGTSKDPEQYPNVEHCAFFNNTQLTIGGTALVCGSVYGGSESGHVMNNTNVSISGGQIGCGEGRTTAYSDSDFESETLPATAHWDYVAEGAPYDQYANNQAQYPDGSSSEGGKPVATDGRTFYGNVFAGGSGYYPYAPGKWLRSAGHTGGTATVTVTGGHILNNLYGGSEMADIDGAVTVNVNGGTVGVPRTKEQYLANPNYGYVFGGGMGDKRVFFNTRTNVSSTTVNVTNGTVFGSVYGGGEDGHVLHDAAVNITPGENTVKIGCDGKSGYDGNVFGGGQGSETAQTAGVISGDVRVRIDGGTMSGSVYGGGRLASVGTYLVPADNANYGKLIPDDWEQVVDDEGIETDVEDPGRKHGEITLTVNGGTIKGSVFGAGKGDRRTKFNTWTNVKSTDVTVTSANIGGSVFGGGEDGHVLRDAVTQINPATGKTIVIGADDGEDNGNVFGGGQGSTTALTAGVVSGNVTLDIKGGTMWGSVYGGGRLAAVGTFLVPPTSEKYGTFIPDGYEQVVINDGPGDVVEAEGRKHGNITVSLTGGTIHGDVFGGGMGTLDDEHGTAAILGISKNVKLDFNKEVATTGVKGCVVLGNIFGCNNMNASPKGTVDVHIYATQNDIATQIQNYGEVTNAKVLNRYDVKAVYGGGNMAAYVPEDMDHGTTNVTIDGCQLTSIQQVYGGGNAASTPATSLTVNGTYEIEEVFGGGNGKDDIVISGETKPNPGANVGFYDYSAVEDQYPTKESRQSQEFINKYVYGTGDASVTILGGTIHRVFGGSNTKGNVKNTAVTMLDQAGGCEFCVDEAYGGGKSAPMDAEAKLLMACIPGLQAVYGGAEAADVHGDVTLNITNGTFKRVFGGNNISGTIDGAIKVNIEEVGCRPIIIGELYGGGNKAAYSIYGYDDDGPKTSGENPSADPQVNLKAFTSIGAVYGGGYGATATMVGSPTVSINEVVGNPTTYPTSGTDGSIGGTFTATGYSGATGVVVDPETGHTVDIPAHVRGKIGAVGKVFGGGNAAPVLGSTTVNVGNLSTIDFESTTAVEAIPVKGADIKGNIYGGGDAAEVTGDASVNVGKKKVENPEP